MRSPSQFRGSITVIATCVGHFASSEFAVSATAEQVNTGVPVQFDSSADGTTEEPTAAAAQTEAKLLGKPVEDTSQTTPTVQKFANPNGGWTSKISAFPVRARNITTGSWQSISTSLVSSADGWRPEAAVGNVVLSAGGSAPLAQMTDAEGRELSWTWPHPLPTPTVSGSTLTYHNAVPNGDLVVRALPNGFSHSIVLRKAPESTLKIPIVVGTNGSSLAQDSSGNLSFKSEGKDTLDALQPKMWDSRRGGNYLRAQPIDVALEKDGSKSVMTLSPSLKFLTSSTTKYPVTIDPSFTLPASYYTTYETPRIERDGAEDPYMTVGYSSDDGHLFRSEFNFTDAAEVGAWGITSASLSMHVAGAASCDAQQVQIKRVTQDGGGDLFPYWEDAPDATTDGPAPIVQSTVGGLAGCSTQQWDTWDVTPIAQQWAAGSNPFGLQVSAFAEDSSTWRRYDVTSPDAPVLTITTDGSAPPAPVDSTALGTTVAQEVDATLTAPANDASPAGTTSIDSNSYMVNATGSFVAADPVSANATATVGGGGLSGQDVATSPASNGGVARPAAAPTSTGWSCVYNTTVGSRLKAYTPLHTDLSNSEWEIHYIDQYYSIANARYVSSNYTTQLEQCVAGGSRNKKSLKRLAKTDGEMSIGGAENHLLAYKWGTGVDDGTVSSNLGFELGAGAAKVSASLAVTNGGHETGSVGSGLCGAIGSNNGNQVNAAWNYHYPGFGTGDFKGNVGQALYEYTTANKTSFNIKFVSCATPRY